MTLINALRLSWPLWASELGQIPKESVLDIRYLVELEAVGDEKPGIQPPSGDRLHEAAHALLAAGIEHRSDPVADAPSEDRSAQHPRKRLRRRRAMTAAVTADG